mmetsp:Transcript_21631/g.50439  ORF Transcript_21631/g.50439 Transcript_21631/m.50439 type:complete len:186 (+) Transcript_21631:124-681(+)
MNPLPPHTHTRTPSILASLPAAMLDSERARDSNFESGEVQESLSDPGSAELEFRSNSEFKRLNSECVLNSESLNSELARRVRAIETAAHTAHAASIPSAVDGIVWQLLRKFWKRELIDEADKDLLRWAADRMGSLEPLTDDWPPTAKQAIFEYIQFYVGDTVWLCVYGWVWVGVTVWPPTPTQVF